MATAPMAALDFVVPSTPNDVMASMVPLKFPKILPKHTRPDQMIKHVPQLDLSGLKSGSDEWMEAYKASMPVRDQIWKRVLHNDPELKSVMDELSKGQQVIHKNEALGYAGAVVHDSKGVPTASYARSQDVMPHEGTHWMIQKLAEINPEYPKAVLGEINKRLDKHRVTGKLAELMQQLGYQPKHMEDEYLAFLTTLRGTGSKGPGSTKEQFKKLFADEEQRRSWMQRAQKAYNEVTEWANELTPEALEQLLKPKG